LRVSRQVWLTDDRGFTILEALIATALVTLVAFTGLAACKMIARVTLSSGAASSAADAVDEQIAALHNDAATAFAVFVPAADRLGHANHGQEIDFFSKADDGRPIRWCYAYDAQTQTLQRWDYDAGGPYGVRNETTGVVDSSVAYPPLKHVARFAATALPADQLGDPDHNTYFGVAGFFAHTPQALPVRYAAPNAPDALGGNGVVQIELANATNARTVHLAAGSMPTGFTVTGVPLWHAIVYRVDQTHRFLIGAAGKSHVFINAHVDVSYDGWATKIPWCDFNLLGAPGGLDPHDPHADYKPNEPVEGAQSILAGCRKRQPLPPPPGSAGFPGDGDTGRAPAPVRVPTPEPVPAPVQMAPQCGPESRSGYCRPQDVR
jgi:Tfp pilus assembly protein PilV